MRAAVRSASGKAEEESDTSVVSATTTTRPGVHLGVARAAEDPPDIP